MCHEVNILNGLHFENPHAKLYLHVLMRYLDFFCILFRRRCRCYARRCQPTQVDDWGALILQCLIVRGGGVYFWILQDKNMKFDVIFHYEIEGNNK